MNERIKALAKQAGFVNLNADYWDCTTDGMIKLAELLVQECITSIEKTIDTNCDNDGEKMGCEYAIANIIDHFGVKE